MFIQKLFSFLLAVFTFFAGLFNANPTVDTTGQDDFVPVIRFAVSSDSHVSSLNDKGCTRIQNMIKTADAIAKEDKNHSTNDAVILVGDMTNSGTKAQFQSVVASVRNSLTGNTRFLGVVAKSHDSNTLGATEALAYFQDLTGQDTDFHEVIHGFHFIGISVSPDTDYHYNPTQLQWLDNELSKAVAEDADKPIFVFQHEHIYNTVYGSYPKDGWGMNYLTDILNKYPQVVDISGHSHYPANDPRAIWQDTFTAINDGGLAYYEFTVDSQRTYHPDNSNDMAQYLLVEVDAQNTVRVRICDLTAGEIVWTHLIDNVSEAHKTKYNQQLQKQNAVAPCFEENAQITYKKGTDKDSFTVPDAKAQAGDIVFLYRFRVTDQTGSEVDTQAQLGNYYYTTKTPGITFVSSQLAEGNTYTVVVIPEDAWGKQGTPLILTVTK